MVKEKHLLFMLCTAGVLILLMIILFSYGWFINSKIVSGDKTTMKHIEIPKDFSKGFCISRTISFIAMQLAVLLGFSEIYLYGFDHSYAKKGHFNEDKFVNAMDYDISDNKRKTNLIKFLISEVIIQKKCIFVL